MKIHQNSETIGSFPRFTCAQKKEAQTISFVKDRPGHDARYAVDTTKIQANLGYKPTVQLRVGLAETVDWYLENEDWWQSILDGSYRSGTQITG